MNARTNRPVASVVELAATRAQRNRGLLGRNGLAPSTALILLQCFSVHTAFMRFSIDVVFIDRHGRAMKIVRDLRPWRIAMALRAHAVVELAAGGLSDLAVGDRVYLDPSPDGVTLLRAAHA